VERKALQGSSEGAEYIRREVWEKWELDASAEGTSPVLAGTRFRAAMGQVHAEGLMPELLSSYSTCYEGFSPS
jgi:hypothetical protein